MLTGAAEVLDVPPPTGPTGPPGRGVLRIKSPDAAGIQPAIDALRAGGIEIRSIVPIRQSLEELFIETVSARPLPPPAPPGGGQP